MAVPDQNEPGRLDPAIEALLDDLVEAAREAHSSGLVVSTSGNVSVRIDESRFAISAARTRLGELTRERVVILPADEVTVSASPRPSRETPLHRAIYREFPTVGAVLHVQSLAATTIACRAGSLPDLCFLPEVAVYVGRVGDVPFLPPGSEDLARAVVDSLREPRTRVVQLRNHGQVVIGDTPRQAVERATFLELAARIFVVSGDGGELRRFTSGERALLWSYDAS